MKFTEYCFHDTNGFKLHDLVTLYLIYNVTLYATTWVAGGGGERWMEGVVLVLAGFGR